MRNPVLGSVGKKQFSGDIDVALDLPPDEIPAFVEKLSKLPEIEDMAKSSVIMTKIKIQGYNPDKKPDDGRARTGYVSDFMPGDPRLVKNILPVQQKMNQNTKVYSVTL